MTSGAPFRFLAQARLHDGYADWRRIVQRGYHITRRPRPQKSAEPEADVYKNSRNEVYERLLNHQSITRYFFNTSRKLAYGGWDAGARTDNTVAVKTIRRGGRVYPYVSAQARRFWWRTMLEARSGWTLSPVTRQAKVAFTSANPFTYPDDDVFGYMRAQREQDGGTLTRISPLKCSPLVEVTDQSPVDDFGVMARQRDGDPVPFEHQFYAVTLKGIFSLDLSGVRTFGELPKTGY